MIIRWNSHHIISIFFNVVTNNCILKLIILDRAIKGEPATRDPLGETMSALPSLIDWKFVYDMGMCVIHKLHSVPLFPWQRFGCHSKFVVKS